MKIQNIDPEDVEQVRQEKLHYKGGFEPFFVYEKKGEVAETTGRISNLDE